MILIKKTQTVYSSISEAARSIGCTKSTISLALKNKREKGVNKLIKKRYIVTPKTEESKVVDSSLPHGSMLWESNAQRVEILDTLNGNSTVYASINLAAQSINCVHGTIVQVIKHFKETGETKLIYKRFQVKPI